MRRVAHCSLESGGRLVGGDSLSGFDARGCRGGHPRQSAPRGHCEAMRIAARRAKEDIVVICFSGRGDKDCFEVAQLRGEVL